MSHLSALLFIIITGCIVGRARSSRTIIAGIISTKNHVHVFTLTGHRSKCEENVYSLKRLYFSVMNLKWLIL